MPIEVIKTIPARKPTPEQLEKLRKIVLDGSSHYAPAERAGKIEVQMRSSIRDGSYSVMRDAGVCVMEAVAYITGQKHTDAPVCVSPVIRQVMIVANDEAETPQLRGRLKALVPEIMGTAPIEVVRETREGRKPRIFERQVGKKKDPHYAAVERKRKAHVDRVLKAKGYDGIEEMSFSEQMKLVRELVEIR